MIAPLQGIGRWLLDTSRSAGESLHLLFQTLSGLGAGLRHPRRVVVQMVRVGWDSFPIVALMAVFTGMTIGLYSGLVLKDVGGAQYQANIVSRAIVVQLGPLLAGILLAGRIGAAFAAEIGTMSVNQEIDALHTLGVDPVRYLAVPRFLAAVFMVPILVSYGNAIGIFGGALVGKSYFDISYEAYLRLMAQSLRLRHIAEGQVKAILYGAIIAIVSCRQGFGTRGGAEGVGKAITSCVVTCSVWIFVANYFVTFLVR